VRTRFKLRSTGLLISLVIGRWHPTSRGKARWTFCMPEGERKNLTIAALLDQDNESVRELWVRPHMKHRVRKLQIREGSDWFSEGERVGSLDDLLDIVSRVQTQRRAPRLNLRERTLCEHCEKQYFASGVHSHWVILC
jgi:hypothetical protein